MGPMSIENILVKRSGNKCELCGAGNGLSAYEIPPKRHEGEQGALLLCESCRGQLNDPSTMDSDHWHCLQSSMWSEHQPVQVMAYRILTALKVESWASELLEQLYLDETLVDWALAELPVGGEAGEADAGEPTLDSNGARLADGDSVTLIKDLDVKGGGFTAKRGTLVKGISLTSNPLHVEGRVNGVQIVLVAKFLKKA